jgi:O-antigen biosynthesis protein
MRQSGPKREQGETFVDCGNRECSGTLVLIRTDGKQFSMGKERFRFRGVTYGTFRPRATDGARIPDRDRLKQDFERMGKAGFTVVRTYTSPSDDLLDAAADWNLRVLAGPFYADWRYLSGVSQRDLRRVLREAKVEVRETARRLQGREEVFALCLGNEIPADVVRWVGTSTIASAIDELVEVVREEDPDRLVTYANYPTAEYLPLESLDFLTFNVFLERQTDLRRYLTRLQHLAGDRAPRTRRNRTRRRKGLARRAAPGAIS